MYTLLYGGTEKAIADWGFINDFEVILSNKAKSTVIFRTPENFDPAAGPQFGWKQPATLYRDRTGIGTGGTVYLKGRFESPRRMKSGEKQYIQYQLHNILWLFERHPFKQHRKQFNGWATPGDPTSGAVLIDKVCPETFLGEKADGTLQTNGQTLAEIIAWVNECYNPTRRGATGGIDATQDVVTAGTINPSALTPKTRANTIFCLEAMNQVCRWCPDAIYKVDDTTTLPTLHVLTLGKWNYGTTPPTFIDYTNLPEVTITITADQEREMQLQTQEGRQLPGVIIYYLSNTTVDSLVVPIITRDAFPLLTGDYDPEVSSHAVELDGSKLIHVTADITTSPISDAVSGTASVRKAWWLAHDKTLSDPNIDPATISATVATIVDDAGATVNLTDFPREFTCPIPQWVKDQFSIDTIHAHVQATLAFSKYADSSHHVPDTVVQQHVSRHSVKLTNAITYTYVAIKSADPGEAIPQGVAESVYRSVNALQSAGRISFVNTPLRSDIYIGCRLKLVGPNTTFSNIIPQQITTRPHHGITEVVFGPSSPVDADALVELARATRWREIYNMPTDRATGTGSGGNTLDDTLDSPSENTSHGVGGAQQLGAVYQQS